jgi:prepilin-type N-terminal cleavage/methylation domain-containing protein
VKKLKNKNKAGFTLIELLVVIAIIGLLASVVLLALNGARAKSRDAKRLADVRQMASALEIFFNDFNSYPTNSSTSLLVPNYIGLTPTAPTPADGTCTPTTNAYTYTSPNYSGSAPTFSLTFCLGATTGGYSAGVRTLTQSGIQ